MTAVFESIEQTAQSYVNNMRYYYNFLLEEMLPFINEHCKDHSIVDCADHEFSFVDELDDYLPWSEKYKKYEKDIRKREKDLLKQVYPVLMIK